MYRYDVVMMSYDVMMMSCKLWNTDTGEDIRSFRFSNHNYSDGVVLYISLSPEADWLAASTSMGVAVVSAVYIALHLSFIVAMVTNVL